MDRAGSTQRSLQTCGGGNVAASSEKWGMCARFTVCACVHAHCYLLFPCTPGELYSWGSGHSCPEN